MSTSFYTENSIENLINSFDLILSKIDNDNIKILDKRGGIIFLGNMSRCSDFIKGFEYGRLRRL